MANVNWFLDALINYDKENIHPEVTKAIVPYLKDPEFEPGFYIIYYTYLWLINWIKFYLTKNVRL